MNTPKIGQNGNNGWAVKGIVYLYYRVITLDKESSSLLDKHMQHTAHIVRQQIRGDVCSKLFDKF